MCGILGIVRSMTEEQDTEISYLYAHGYCIGNY